MIRHKVCPRCGAPFIDHDGRKKYCSVSCGAKRSNYDTNSVLCDLSNFTVSEILTRHQISRRSLYQLAYKHSILIRNRDYRLALDERQLAVIRGSLLGDAHASRLPSGKWRLSFRHGPTQYEYVDWKYRVLQSIVGTPPRTILTPRAYGSEIRTFTTKANAIVASIAELLYCENVKTVTIDYLKTIDSIALAVWMMDDGSLGKNGGHLSTHSFTKNESELIATWLGRRYSLPQSKLVLDKRCNRWSISLSTDIAHAIASECFSIIEQIPAMFYKVAWYGKNPIDQTPSSQRSSL